MPRIHLGYSMDKVGPDCFRLLISCHIASSIQSISLKSGSNRTAHVSQSNFQNSKFQAPPKPRTLPTPTYYSALQWVFHQNCFIVFSFSFHAYTLSVFAPSITQCNLHGQILFLQKLFFSLKFCQSSLISSNTRNLKKPKPINQPPHFPYHTTRF